MRKWMTGWVGALAVAVLAAGLRLSGPALAATPDQPDGAGLHRRAPLRLHVGPAPSERLYRQCTDWHVIEHRATGDTVVPRMRCWWALR
jgi:hypothetical protein